MTGNAEFLAFFCAAMSMVFQSGADHRLPAPKNLLGTWVDSFTINVSWSWDTPEHLPDDCKVEYVIQLPDRRPARTPKHSYSTGFFLTEDQRSNEWKFSIRALAKSCVGWNESEAKNGSISTQKPRADVVKDFKCSMTSHETNCSWEPVSPSDGLNVSYRFCEKREDKSSKRCHQVYCHGKGNRCSLQKDAWKTDIYVLAENEAGLQTFKAKRVMPLPKLNITEDGYQLNLEWTPPDIIKHCSLNYLVCYTECKTHQPCLVYTSNANTPKHGPLLITYNKSCLYEFKFNATTDKYCASVYSDGTAVEYYGNNTHTSKLSDGTLTVVAIVIPVVLSVAVILSCYCFRRHRAILCPTMPDPSAIFKEMMNGNKEPKTTSESLYTPLPEPIEHCTITPLTENSFFQQNS